MRNRGNFAIGKQPEISLTSYGKWNDYEQDSFNFSIIFHLQSAKKNGITRTEIAEIITHIGFYAGWPKAWAAFNLAKDVWAKNAVGEDAKAAFQREMI